MNKRKVLTPEEALTWNFPPNKPTKQEIEETIELIKDRLLEPGMLEPQNEAVKFGYKKAIEYLEERDENYNGISWIKDQQAKSISVQAIEYLKGEVFQKDLLGVPLKEKK